MEPIIERLASAAITRVTQTLITYRATCFRVVPRVNIKHATHLRYGEGIGLAD